jgi:hypothetical protein
VTKNVDNADHSTSFRDRPSIIGEDNMAFGFPAHHMEQLGVIPPQQTIKDVLASLRWKVRSEAPAKITASTSVNLWSWGERVVIEFFNDGILVTSSCALPTQCIDWGKNKRNVKKFINALEQQI